MIEKKVENLTLDELEKMPKGSQVDLTLSFRKSWTGWTLRGNVLGLIDIEYYLLRAKEIWVKISVPEEPSNHAVIRIKKDNGTIHTYHRDDFAYKGVNENTRWRLLTVSGVPERILSLACWETIFKNSVPNSLEILYAGDE